VELEIIMSNEISRPTKTSTECLLSFKEAKREKKKKTKVMIVKRGYQGGGRGREKGEGVVG
jgi:hypothetical protein